MPPRIFIASSTESRQVAYAMQALIERDAEATVWDQNVFRLTSTTLADLLNQLDRSDFGIFVMTGDDELRSRGTTSRTVRDNVLFEAGLFLGRLGPERTFLLQPRDGPAAQLASDLAGITVALYTANRSDGNLDAALGPAAEKIRRAILQAAPRTSKNSEFFRTVRELRVKGHLDAVTRSGRRDIFFGGVALRGTIHREREVLEDRIREGADFKFLLMNPDAPAVSSVAAGFGVRESDLRAAIEISLGGIERLQKIAYRESGSVSVRLVSAEPPFSFAIADPNDADGVLVGGLRAYGLSAARRPEWVLTPESVWFRPLVNSCISLWNEVGEQRSGSAKAGVVVYRLSQAGEFEVLLISSRADPKTWVFPMGGVESGETAADAAVRECREETGHHVAIERRLGEVDFGPDLGPHVFFLARLDHDLGTREPDRKIAWCPMPQLAERVPAAFRPIAELAIESVTQ